jgi:hypothetical protein
VVDAYMQQHSKYHRSSNHELKQSLEKELTTLEYEIQQKTAELRKPAAIGRLDLVWPRLAVQAAENDADPALQPAVLSVTAEQYAWLSNRLLQAELDLIDARARLEAARLAGDRGGAKPREPQPQQEKQAAQRSTPEGPSWVSEGRLRELESAVEEAKRRKIGYVQYIQKLTVESKTQNHDTLSYKLGEQDLARLATMQTRVKEKLRQLDFEIGQDKFRVTLVDRAREPKTPSNTVRLILMMVAPTVVFLLLVGLFSLAEIRAGRAGGPSSLGPPA